MKKAKWYKLDNVFRPVQTSNHCSNCVRFANLGVLKSEENQFKCRLCLCSGQGLPMFTPKEASL